MNKLLLTLFSLGLALTLAGCETPPPEREKEYIYVVEIVDIGKCEGSVCMFITPKGQTVFVTAADQRVVGGKGPGQITLGHRDQGTDQMSGFHVQGFLISDEPIPRDPITKDVLKEEKR